MSNKKLLVSGATGYIGYHLLSHVRNRLSTEFTPIALVRQSSYTLDLEQLLDYPHPRSEPAVRVASLSDVSSLREAVRGVTHVVHLAADMDFFPRDPARLMHTNVEGTRNLLEACSIEASEKGSRMRFVFVSSTEAIGTVDELGRAADESDLLNPDCDYGRSKVMAESIVREFSSRLECCILRVTGVYGPGERFFFHEFASMVEAGLLYITPGPLDGSLMMSHIDDVILAIILAVTKDEAVNQCYIVAPDEGHTYMELTKILSTAFRRRPPFASIPMPMAKFIVSAAMPILNIARRRIFMIHPDSIRKTTKTRTYSNAKIKRELGYQPRCTRDGIEDTIQTELRTGGMKRHAIAPVISGSITLCSLIFYGFSRVFLLRDRQ